ncbi:unnamed protein product [Alopecurus aequalis]
MLMKHTAERAAANKPLFVSQEDSSKNSAGKKSRWFEVMKESQQYAEIQSALLRVQEKLANNKSRGKMDKETLRQLKDMANKLLDQAGGGDDDDEKDDTNEVELDEKMAAEVEMAKEEKAFASYRRLWEYKRGKTCGSFTEPTVLSSMQFTHYTPGRRPFSSDCYTPETLQIVSIKLTGLDGGLELPCSVYGVVAVRDTVDRNRNILFFRDSSEAQELKQNDPFLRLIGPSRAIVLTDKAWIEIELRVKAGSQDKALMSLARCYTGGDGPGVSSFSFKNALCTLELCLQPVKRTVQATILGVQVDGSWPFRYGGLVACIPLAGTVMVTDGGLSRKIDPSSSSKIVLIESEGEALPKGEGGHVHLWRQVVSVEGKGRLDVVIQAYSKTGDIAAETRVPFYPKVSNMSQKKCALGDAEVTVTVAWSLVAASKTGLSIELSGRRCV